MKYVFNALSGKFDLVDPDTRIPTVLVAADGTGDYTDIQDGIDALPVAGGLVFIKDGTYTIDTTILITKSNVTIQGQGAATILTAADNLDDNVIEIGDGLTAFQDIEIKNIKIDGNKANQASGSGIYITDEVTRFKLNGCVIYQTKNKGCWLSWDCNYSVIKDCTFESIDDYGLLLTSASYCEIQGNYFISCGIVSGQMALLVYGVESNVVGNIFYDTKTVNSAEGLYLQYAHRTVVSSNVFYGCKYGLQTDGLSNSENCTIANNVFRGLYSHAIVIAGSFWSITGNIFSWIGGDAIYLCYGNCEITGNQFFYISGNGITQMLNYCNISGNYFYLITLVAITVSGQSCVINGNTIYYIGREAIITSGSDRCIISNNLVIEVGNTTNNTYAAILVNGTSQNNIITGNIVNSTVANKMKYGIREDSTGDGMNKIENNIVSGAVTANISLQNVDTFLNPNVDGWKNPDDDVWVAKNHSARVVRKFTIASGKKLTIGSGGIFRVL